MQDFIHCKDIDFSQITTQGKHAFFKWDMSKICHPKNLAFRISTFCLSADGFASWYCEEFQFESLNTTRTRVQVSRAAEHHYLSAAILI
jgi:hypothetical protein